MRPQSAGATGGGDAGAAGGGDAARRSTRHLRHLPDGAVKEASREVGRGQRREPVRHQQPAGLCVPPRVRVAVTRRARCTCASSRSCCLCSALRPPPSGPRRALPHGLSEIVNSLLFSAEPDHRHSPSTSSWMASSCGCRSISS